MKRIFALFVALALTVATVSAAAIDVKGNPSVWAQEEVEDARRKGLIVPEADGNYQNSISRVLFCKLVVNMVEKIDNEVTITVNNPFGDTDDEDVIKAYQLGIVKGISATEFAPDKNITRQEIAAMMMRAARVLDVLKNENYTENIDVSGFNFKDENLIADWAITDMKELNGLGIMIGVGNDLIDPLGNTTIEQSILLILRLYDDFKEEMGGSGGGGSGGGGHVNHAPKALGNPVELHAKEQVELIIKGSDLASDSDNDPLKITKINKKGSITDGKKIVTDYGTLTLLDDGTAKYLSKKINLKELKKELQKELKDDFAITVTDGRRSVEVKTSIIIVLDNMNMPPVPKGNPVKFATVEKKLLSIKASELATDKDPIYVSDILDVNIHAFPLLKKPNKTNMLKTKYGVLSLTKSGVLQYVSNKLPDDVASKEYKENVYVVVTDNHSQVIVHLNIYIKPINVNIPPKPKKQPVRFKVLEEKEIVIEGEDLAVDTDDIYISKIGNKFINKPKVVFQDKNAVVKGKYGTLSLDKSGRAHYKANKLKISLLPVIATDNFVAKVTDGKLSVDVEMQITVLSDKEKPNLKDKLPNKGKPDLKGKLINKD